MHGIPFKFAERKGQGLRLWGSGTANKPSGKTQRIPTDSGEAQMQDVKRDS